MKLSVKVEVWGEYACFSRPELKTERYSYEVITPSAARGLLEAIYWHPGMRWIVDKIFILSPVDFTNIRRNEIKSKIPASKIKSAMLEPGAAPYISAAADRLQRASTVLKNVHYVIEAHFEMTDKANESDNPGKFQDIIRRRLEKGQCWHRPYLGCREFPAKFREWKTDDVPTAYPDSDRSLGFMLYDMDYSDLEDIKPMFFNAVLRKGILDLTEVRCIK